MSSQWPGAGDYWGDQHQPRSPGAGGGPHGTPSGPWQPPPPPPPVPYSGYGAYPGPGAPSGPPPARGNAVLSLIIAIIVTLTCCGITNIIGIVFASVALSKEQEPEEFERLTRWAWLSNFVHIGFLVLMLVLFVMLSYVA